SNTKKQHGFTAIRRNPNVPRGTGTLTKRSNSRSRLTLRLAQGGIMVGMIETEQQISEEPRAVTYYASALTALDKMRIIPDMKEAGFVSARLSWRKLSGTMHRAVITWGILSIEELFPVIESAMAVGGYCI
ncbi:hypothetical protein N7522_010714, partial [Penicillium canescens]